MENIVKKGKKVAILGAGNVGASIAFTLALKGLCSEMVLIDINKDKAKGEAMDIMQGTAFCPSIEIKNGDYPIWLSLQLVLLESRDRPESIFVRPMQRLWLLLCRKSQNMHRMQTTS